MIVVLVVLSALAVAWLLARIWTTLVLLLISGILATGLAPLVSLVEGAPQTRRPRVPKAVAILAIYLAFFLVVGLFFSEIVAVMVAEGRDFVRNLPGYVGQLEQWARDFQPRVPWFPDVDRLISRVPEELASLGNQIPAAAGILFRFLGSILSVITVLVFAYYMLVGGPGMKRGFLILWPPEMRPQVERVLRGIGVKFGAWLRGQVLLMVIIFAAATAGLSVLRVPYAVVLGAIAGLFEAVPIVGAVVGAIPAVIVAMFGPLWQTLAVVALFVLIQQLEGNVIVPRVMRHAVGLSPLVTLTALLVGAQLMGVVGALISIPVAAALQVVYAEVVTMIRAQRGETVDPGD